MKLYNICEHINMDNLCVGIFTYKNFYELQTPVNKNFEKVGFCKIRTCRYPQLSRFTCWLQTFTEIRPCLVLSTPICCKSNKLCNFTTHLASVSLEKNT